MATKFSAPVVILGVWVVCLLNSPVSCAACKGLDVCAVDADCIGLGTLLDKPVHKCHSWTTIRMSPSCYYGDNAAEVTFADDSVAETQPRCGRPPRRACWGWTKCINDEACKGEAEITGLKTFKCDKVEGSRQPGNCLVGIAQADLTTAAQLTRCPKRQE